MEIDPRSMPPPAVYKLLHDLFEMKRPDAKYAG